MIPTCGSVIGIDVGCSSTRRSSALCLLKWSGDAISWKISRFRALEPERAYEIARAVAGCHVISAAIDGPLRRNFDVIGHYRAAERMLTRRLRPLIGKPGQSSTPVGRQLNRHANECVRHLRAHADVGNARHGVPIAREAIVEAFPSSFLGMMIEAPEQLEANRASRSDTYYQHLATTGRLRELIQHCLPGRLLKLDLSKIVNHDDRAAMVCALTALCVAAEDFMAVGDDDGWIVLPPRRFVQPRQAGLVVDNAKEEKEDGKTGRLHIECHRSSTNRSAEASCPK